MSEKPQVPEELLNEEELIETNEGENGGEIVKNPEKPIFDNNAAELLSALVVIASITINTEAIAPNIEMAAGAFHILFFLLFKEAWKIKENGEYSRKDLAQALTRISAPFLAGGIITNGEQVLQTLNNIDQTIGFTKAASEIAPTVFKAVLGGVAGSVAIGGVGYLGVKAINGLVNGYRNIKDNLTKKVQSTVANIKSYEPQSPLHEPKNPVKTIEFQSPVKKVEWQSPIKFSWPWKKKRSENG